VMASTWAMTTGDGPWRRAAAGWFGTGSASATVA
jgi:hypothetical protein